MRVGQICNQLGDLEVKKREDLDRAVHAYADQLAADHLLVKLSPGDIGEERDVAICEERIPATCCRGAGKVTDAQGYYEQELAGIYNMPSQLE